MSGDEELERLLREVDASLSPAAGGPPRAGKDPAARTPALRHDSAAPAERGRVGTALRTGVVAGAVCGGGVWAVTFFFSWLPFDQHPIDGGIGAFVGAFLTGTVLSARGARR